jgi:hypothetical protein
VHDRRIQPQIQGFKDLDEPHALAPHAPRALRQGLVRAPRHQYAGFLEGLAQSGYIQGSRLSSVKLRFAQPGMQAVWRFIDPGQQGFGCVLVIELATRKHHGPGQHTIFGRALQQQRLDAR